MFKIMARTRSVYCTG